MNINLHKNARTTPAVRKEIRESTASETELALHYGLSRATIHKWRTRQDTEDASHCPHTLQTTLTPAQEIIVVEIRKTLLLPIDDLLVVVREFMNKDVSRSGLERCLKRHGVSSLKMLRLSLEPEMVPQVKTFKEYDPGFIHIDIKYLPRMPDESEHRYLYVGIDRPTRWVYLEVLANKDAVSTASFLERLVGKAPFIISKVLTDNGKEFTDRFTANGEREPTGHHVFDKVCTSHGIEHRLITPYHPQTNGMVERFNGRIQEILKSTKFGSREDLEETLIRYARIYNGYIPQRALGHISPVEALKNWQEKRPELFKTGVYNHPGLDTLKPASTLLTNSLPRPAM